MTKRSWPLHTTLSLAAALLAGVFAANAQQPAQKIDVSKLSYAQSDVVIPNPSEVFAALDKLGGSPNWSKFLNPTPTTRPTQRAEVALLMGTVIANGFVAVEAKDKNAVDDIGRKVSDLAYALGVREFVIQHSNAITTAATAGDWSKVRTELDKAKASVTGAMDKLGDRELSQLISIAGWLRGTQTLTAITMDKYQPERAELLNQSDILTTFEKQFGRMGKIKDNKQVVKLRDGLKKVSAIIHPGLTEPVSEKSVSEINAITNELVREIEH